MTNTGSPRCGQEGVRANRNVDAHMHTTAFPKREEADFVGLFVDPILGRGRDLFKCIVLKQRSIQSKH
jgi:hypothetical protein